MKTIVISGINLFEGGPLSIYKDCLDNIIKGKLNETNKIIAFVHKKELFVEYEGKVTLMELPKSRKNYLYRLWYEYIYFYFYSRNKNIDVWLSLHDITPNVKAKKRYVYCHNPSPFMKTELKNLKYSYKNFLFSIFYKYLYKINIKKNTAVIVQQDWIRKEFQNMFLVENIIVARPDVKFDRTTSITNTCESRKSTFIYSAYPRFFKNYEVIAEACRILNEDDLDYEVRFTVDGTENAYSKYLYKEYGNIKSIKWLGIVDRTEMMRQYGESNYLIFPSLLETWGLPITEYKGFSKPIVCANLPYAHETIGTYDKVTFFNPTKASELASIMRDVINGNHAFTKTVAVDVVQPVSNGWGELIEILIN